MPFGGIIGLFSDLYAPYDRLSYSSGIYLLVRKDTTLLDCRCVGAGGQSGFLASDPYHVQHNRWVTDAVITDMILQFVIICTVCNQEDIIVEMSRYFNVNEFR